jgi:hypothetical protein
MITRPTIMIMYTNGVCIPIDALRPFPWNGLLATGVPGRPAHVRKDGMKEVDELALKAEIDEISKKIDAIVQNIDRMDPDKQDGQEGEDPPAS